MAYQFSDVLDDPLLTERMESFGAGVDGFNPPTELAPNVSQYFENVVVRDKKRPRTRPGADSLGSAPGGANPIQGLHYFDIASKEQLLAGSNGKVWAWEGAAWADTGIALTDAALEYTAAQGIDKLLLSDGTAQMRSWDGTNWTGALGSTPTDPPVGARILVWHTGRMFASGVASRSDTIEVSNRLAFGTGDWNRTTRSFRVGGGDGDPINGLASMQGFTLAVLKENSIWLVETDPRNEPADFSTQAAGQTVSFGIGCVGRHAFCSYGNDLLFMSRFGVQSLQRMQAAAGQYQLSAPVSLPIQSYIDRINWTYAHLIRAWKYKELVFFAIPLDTSTYNNAVLVWNGRLTQPDGSPGAWLGVWTGWTPAAWAMTRFSGAVRLVFGERTGKVRQWKDYSDADDDSTYTEDTAAIATKVWTRATQFMEPESDKDAYHAEVRFTSSNAIVSITAVADNADLKLWQKDVRKVSVDLPVDLPFDLASPAARATRRGLRGLPPFNEVYLKIESTSGWWELRTITLTAYLNRLQTNE